MKYWIYKDCQILGPLAKEDLSLAGLRPETLICADDSTGTADGDWRCASEVEGLTAVCPAESAVAVDAPFDSESHHRVRFDTLAMPAGDKGDWLAAIAAPAAPGRPLFEESKSPAPDFSAGQAQIRELEVRIRELQSRLAASEMRGLERENNATLEKIAVMLRAALPAAGASSRPAEPSASQAQIQELEARIRELQSRLAASEMRGLERENSSAIDKLAAMLRAALPAGPSAASPREPSASQAQIQELEARIREFQSRLAESEIRGRERENNSALAKMADVLRMAVPASPSAAETPKAQEFVHLELHSLQAQVQELAANVNKLSERLPTVEATRTGEAELKAGQKDFQEMQTQLRGLCEQVGQLRDRLDRPQTREVQPAQAAASSAEAMSAMRLLDPYQTPSMPQLPPTPPPQPERLAPLAPRPETLAPAAPEEPSQPLPPAIPSGPQPPTNQPPSPPVELPPAQSPVAAAAEPETASAEPTPSFGRERTRRVVNLSSTLSLPVLPQSREPEPDIVDEVIEQRAEAGPEAAPREKPDAPALAPESRDSSLAAAPESLGMPSPQPVLGAPSGMFSSPAAGSPVGPAIPETPPMTAAVSVPEPSPAFGGPPFSGEAMPPNAPSTQEVLAKLAKPRAVESQTPPRPPKRGNSFMLVLAVLAIGLAAAGSFFFLRDSKDIKTAVSMDSGRPSIGAEVPEEPVPSAAPSPAVASSVGATDAAQASPAGGPITPPQAEVPAAGIRDERPAAISLVKNYPLDGERGTIGGWLQYSFASAPGSENGEKWDAGAVEESTYLVQYAVQRPGGKVREAISYLFEADVARKTVKGKNPAARELLAGGPASKAAKAKSKARLRPGAGSKLSAKSQPKGAVKSKTRPKTAAPRVQAQPKRRATPQRTASARRGQSPLLPLPADADLLPPASDDGNFGAETVRANP